MSRIHKYTILNEIFKEGKTLTIQHSSIAVGIQLERRLNFSHFAGLPVVISLHCFHWISRYVTLIFFSFAAVIEFMSLFLSTSYNDLSQNWQLAMMPIAMKKNCDQALIKINCKNLFCKVIILVMFVLGPFKVDDLWHIQTHIECTAKVISKKRKLSFSLHEVKRICNLLSII